MATLASATMTDGERRGERPLDPDAALAVVIAERRSRLGLDPAELGRLAELDESQVLAIEAGRLEPTWGDLRRLAKALEVGLPELLAEVEERAERWDA
jgi:transcriptional regulator with XRE-family HTH domain